MKTPDVTPAQIVALVQAVLGLAVAFGAPISEVQSGSVVGLVAVIAAVLLHSDAKIRSARAVMHGKIEMSKVIMPDGEQ